MSGFLRPPWTIAHPAPLSMGFHRQEHCSRLPFLPPGDLPDPGMEPPSPTLEGRFFTTEPPGKPREAESCPQMKHPIREVCRPQLSSLECVAHVVATSLCFHGKFVEFYLHQLSKCRGLMSTLTLHPSGVHFHRLPETSVFCSGGSSYLLLLAPLPRVFPVLMGRNPVELASNYL